MREPNRRLGDPQRHSDTHIDPLAGLLRQTYTHAAVVQQITYRAPWTVRYNTPPPLTAFAVLSGKAVLVPADGSAQAAVSGDLILVQGSAPVVLSDSLRHPEGARHGDTTVVLSGTYPELSRIYLRLLASLPPVMHLPADDAMHSLLDVVVREIAQNQPGQQAIVERLLDVLVTRVMREWLTRTDPHGSGWFRALGDEVVGPALRALHEQPTRRWTVASLAAKSGVSRVVFARRFTKIVGEPPLTYLTGWRMTLAADMLRQPDVKVTAIARDVGYADAFAFSTAFKRTYGISPSHYRATL